MLMLAAALLGTVQIGPEDAEVACIVERTPPADRAALQRVAAADRLEDAPLSFGRAVLSCAEGSNGSSERSTQAQVMALALILRDESRSRIVETGIDASAIDRWFLRQGGELFERPDTVLTGSLPALLVELEAIGPTRPLNEQQRANVLMYVGGHIGIERVRRGLVANQLSSSAGQP